jgi:serine/threonine protein kinase
VKVRRLQPGELFAARYLVEGFIGQGAMGSVYRAIDRASGAPRALKVMSVDLLAAPHFVERFVQEAKIGARIESDLVVRVFETGVDETTKLPYFAMELLEGEDLQRKLDRGAELDRSLVHRLLAMLFQAMSAAHAANVVHRDLKPENLFIVEGAGGPTLKVLDFGVAKVVKETTTVGGTMPGLGAPLWTAPEQGREGQTIRPSADVWALGLLTFRLLSGKLYWLAASREKASAFDLAVEMLRAPLVPASVRANELGARDLGPAFDAWFARAVDRDPSRRYPDAKSAFAELAPMLERQSSLAPLLERGASAPASTLRRAPRARAVAAVAAIAALVLAGWLAWHALGR